MNIELLVVVPAVVLCVVLKTQVLIFCSTFKSTVFLVPEALRNPPKYLVIVIGLVDCVCEVLPPCPWELDSLFELVNSVGYDPPQLSGVVL